MAADWITIDGNEAAASVAYRLSDVMAIYPITPSTPMGESADAWSAASRPNLWGAVPSVIEMQSEAGAAGAIHGSLQRGALTSTFTASQGLLLMIPNMYKIAGELTPAVFHVAARSLAAQALSIFGDHSDVMAARSTGWAMLASSTVQEAQDLALVAHAATLKARIPFVHFFDGFRTSHEINKIRPLADDDMRALIDQRYVEAHRLRALSPAHPVLRGTAQNPDVYFQARETVNPFYAACPEIVQAAMDQLAARIGRQYRLFEYAGAPDAERVIVVMGSGSETARETATALAARGEKVGVVTVHLFRPFSPKHLIAALPSTVRSIAVLDRTKEAGDVGEPLYVDVVTALAEAEEQGESKGIGRVRVIGGRYGLSSKEFTPAMAKAVFDNLSATTPQRHFTVGIRDDVGGTSLDYDPTFSIEPAETVRCIFWGLGSDGTVGANKNSIKIIGEETENHAQGYFVYDSKKAGSVTTSHLRFGPRAIHAPYLVESAQFVACHNFALLERYDVLDHAAPGAVFLLNSPYAPEEVWSHLPAEVQQTILDRHLRFYTIDANAVARETGMGRRINTIMQTCFFAVSGVLPRDEAIASIKHSVEKTYAKRGEAVVRQNFEAVDRTLAHLHEVPLPAATDSRVDGAPRPLPVAAEAPAFVRDVLGPMIAGKGDSLPVSALPCDGTYPTGTARWEKRNLAEEIPIWDPQICIQCGKCTIVCPHAAIRTKVCEPSALEGAPESFVAVDAHFKEFPNAKYILQVAPEDCTGCALCFEACPVKDKSQAGRRAINMTLQPPIREREREKWDFFTRLPEVSPTDVALNTIKGSQLMEPLFEFSGACSGCGETPYLKLLTQLFGDHLLVANATGCSSIYGGNLPTTPWSANRLGRGPAWSNSLFEDNAEYGLGMRVALDQQEEQARALVERLRAALGDELVDGLLTADQSTPAGVAAQRARIESLRGQLAMLSEQAGEPSMAAAAHSLLSLAETLGRTSVWIVGGDGWAYDIGYGGLDHVLASGRNVNILVLDTEVYSNTGGQASKSTPRAAVAKFAARGKATAKKDLGMLAMAYGSVYVAKVALGANDAHTLRTLLEAEAYDGPSLIIAYSHCIAHGIDMRRGLDQQKLAVQTGYWPLYHFDPRQVDEGKNPLTLDSKAPSLPLEQYAYNETRYRMLALSDPARAAKLMEQAQGDVTRHWEEYRELADEPAPALHPHDGEAARANGHQSDLTALAARKSTLDDS